MRKMKTTDYDPTYLSLALGPHFDFAIDNALSEGSETALVSRIRFG